MANKYTVFIKQIVEYPIEVIAEDSQDAVDSIHQYPSKLTSRHILSDTRQKIPCQIIKTGTDIIPEKKVPYVITSLDEPIFTDIQIKNTISKFTNHYINEHSKDGYPFIAGYFGSVLYDLMSGKATTEDILNRMDHTLTKSN